MENRVNTMEARLDAKLDSILLFVQNTSSSSSSDSSSGNQLGSSSQVGTDGPLSIALAVIFGEMFALMAASVAVIHYRRNSRHRESIHRRTGDFSTMHSMSDGQPTDAVVASFNPRSNLNPVFLEEAEPSRIPASNLDV